MPYDTKSVSYNRIFNSIGTRQPPYSNPAPVLLSQSLDKHSESRSGVNSPYIKGGILHTTVKTVKTYRAIIGYTWIPVRHKVFYRDKYGRRSYRYVIRHKKKNVWGLKTRIYEKWVRVKGPDPGLLLTPNNLTYNASSQNESDGSSFFIDYKGQPFQVNINNYQSGAKSGVMSGSAVGLGPVTDPFQSLPVTSFIMDELRRRSLAKLYAKVQDEKANLALMAAEGNKTIGLISDIFFSGIRFARSLKKLELAKAGKVVGASRQQLASRWLQFVYGVQPLMSEVNKIIEDISGSCKAVRKYSASSTRELTHVSSTTPSPTSVTTSYTIKLTVKAAVLVDTSVSIPKAAVSYGFAQPLAVAWELVPFSFVADWFYPLGGWLTSCHALDSNVMSFYYTDFIKTDIEYSSYHFRNTSQTQGGGSGPSGTKTAVYCKRSIQAVPPLPLPSLNTQPFSPRRVYNALALLLQRS